MLELKGFARLLRSLSGQRMLFCTASCDLTDIEFATGLWILQCSLPKGPKLVSESLTFITAERGFAAFEGTVMQF